MVAIPTLKRFVRFAEKQILDFEISDVAITEKHVQSAEVTFWHVISGFATGGAQPATA